LRGFRFSLDAMWADVSVMNLQAPVAALQMPVVPVRGRHDRRVPPEVSVANFEMLTAPSKKRAWFEKSGYESGLVFVALLLGPQFAVLYLATLTAYRVLMTWMFAHTGRLLLAVLMHASYTGWLLALFLATSFEQGLAWLATLAVVLWLWAAVVTAVFVRLGRTGAIGGHCLG